MSLVGGEVIAARETVKRHSIKLLLARDRGTEAALYFACRRLVRCLDANRARQPKGWRDDDHETPGVAAAARDAVHRALALLLAELELAMTEDSVPALMRAETALYFAARRLVAAIDTDRARQPPGWRDEDREAARS
jgi:hypothetical protein